MSRKNRLHAVAYYQTSSAGNVGADKDSEKRQRDAVHASDAALLSLLALPIRRDVRGVVDDDVTEHVRMPPDELVRDARQRIGDREVPGFRLELRQKDGFEQKVAELFA